VARSSDSEAAAPVLVSSRLYIWLKRLVNVEPEELKALTWSFTYFFALLCSYYILRPLRDEMGIAGGVKNLQWLFTGTFLAMLVVVPLFGWIASRYPRKRFLPYVYYFFIANIVLFFVLFQSNITHAKVHHMVDNMAAGFGRLPDAEMRNRMIRHFESL
jgi:AAA family ATP:ADP antiporter